RRASLPPALVTDRGVRAATYRTLGCERAFVARVDVARHGTSHRTGGAGLRRRASPRSRRRPPPPARSRTRGRAADRLDQRARALALVAAVLPPRALSPFAAGRHDRAAT